MLYYFDRRQQEERDRAQQDDRRRTDMMLSMRQQELARGRGPIDPPGMRSREELMVCIKITLTSVLIYQYSVI